MSTSNKKLASGANLLALLRERKKLTQAEAADLLDVSRNYISMIENGRAPGRKFLAALERELAKSEHPQVSAADYMVREDPAPYGTAEGLRREIRNVVEQAILAAGEDVGRLGWLREQVLRHTSVPEHWDVVAKAIADQKDAEDRKDREALGKIEEKAATMARPAHSARAHGKAS